MQTAAVKAARLSHQGHAALSHRNIQTAVSVQSNGMHLHICGSHSLLVVAVASMRSSAQVHPELVAKDV